ncbi:MAG: serine/threonine-protein kinase, partial [Planctomycetota bacterium]|nr:serine/threonine-protein kinase [Planctomycetota bacterium]
QIGGQLQHPGIVPVYELGLMADESPYFTMKLVKGRTLSALFQQRKSTSDDRGRLLSIFESVCQTVAYAHSKGVLHRDLKPANIMVGAFGEVQVVDWGLAKVLSRGGVADEKRAQDSLFTVIETVRSGPGSSGSDSLAGSVMGTPAYMAPEQAQGDVDLLDERADVFSLGAILCELLTGKPPYEAIEGESLLAQAARAKLQPARARIEACGADPALIKLCLECLTPARELRPSSAGAVAHQLHEYLVSVETRAQQAELATAEERIKTEGERRRRRLTVALASAIIVGLGLTSAGFWWANQERARRAEEQARRVAQTTATVEAAYAESIELAQKGKHDEALVAARRAQALAEGGDANEALLERTHKFVAQAQLESEAAARERTLVEQDETLRSRLIELRVAQMATIGNEQRETELDSQFTAAFRDYGVDLEGADLVPALTRIRERDIAEEVALALDDWGRLRRKVHGANSERAENLFVLAMDLDPDPARMRMREAIAARDVPTMLELTAPENLPKLEPGSIFVLSAALWEKDERHPDVLRILGEALRLHPGDYVLQAVGGLFNQQSARFEAALTCRSAALSLRPRDIAARVAVAESQHALGYLLEARANLRICLAMDPSHTDANYQLGLTQLLLGDFAGALASFERSPVIEATPNMRSDVFCARYYNGLMSKESIERLCNDELAMNNVLTYLFALVDHPDPAQRDPQFVLRALAERGKVEGFIRWIAVVESMARLRLEDWEGALAALQRIHHERMGIVVMTPPSRDFMLSILYSRLGRTAEAKDSHERGMLLWTRLTGDEPAAWERSDMARWRRESESLLPK